MIVPETTPTGTFTLCAGITDWIQTNGSLGPSLSWDTVLEVVAERKPPSAPKRNSGENNVSKGDRNNADEDVLLALLWRNSDEVAGWHDGVPGHVEDVPADILAKDDGPGRIASCAGDDDRQEAP